MGRSKEYSSEVKAAVMAALLTGQSVSSVSAEYRIPVGTVKSWKSRQKDEPVAMVATQKKKDIGVLLVEYVELSLESLKVQVQHFGDKDWLTTQDADALAVLHGVQADKAIRLLEAIAAAQEPE